VDQASPIFWAYDLEAMTLKFGEKVGTRPFPITKACQGFFSLYLKPHLLTQKFPSTVEGPFL